MRWTVAALASGLLFACPAASQSAKPLFQGDAPISLTLSGPFAAIADDRERETGLPGLLSSGGEQMPVLLAPRGITRRASDICDFPPLRVEFAAPPAPSSLLAGQHRLKLVTHCRRGEGHQQYVLLEYAAYRLYNALTPLSFRVRLARVDYRESSGRPVATRFGFFIEDFDDVARRNGLPRMQAGDRISPSALSAREAARGAMFEYLIGNLDWSMRAGPRGEGCCHNFRLLSGPDGKAVPVPYDFDFSGLVDAPYATPPEGLGVPSVRVRKYRGYCLHNAEALLAAQELRAKQGEFAAILSSLPLRPQVSRKAAAYLQGFFAQVRDDQTVRDQILRFCVR